MSDVLAAHIHPSTRTTAPNGYSTTLLIVGASLPRELNPSDCLVWHLDSAVSKLDEVLLKLLLKRHY